MGWGVREGWGGGGGGVVGVGYLALMGKYGCIFIK